ncbi:MAG: adenylyl-sulfate kinase [Fimbriimonas sp.]
MRDCKLDHMAGAVIWMTGLSGAGKSTLSDLLRQALLARRVFAIQIDGDALRAGLCRDLGFTEEARTENIRRAAEVAKLLADQGCVVIASFISPLRAQREFARATVGDSFIEVHVHCPLEEAILRDPKGLYKRAISGELANFTGISSPYEAPMRPDVVVDTSILSKEECTAKLLGAVRSATFGASYLDAGQ